MPEVRIRWRKPNALKGAAQRTPYTLKTPAGNSAWYKKWYEFLPGAPPTYLETVSAMNTDDLDMPSSGRQELDRLRASIKPAPTRGEAERSGVRA